MLEVIAGETYFATVLLNNGDIFPGSENQLLFLILLMVCTFFLTGIIITQFSNIVDDLGKSQRQENSLLESMMEIIFEYKLENEMQDQLMAYFDFQKKTSVVQEADFYSVLPDSLRGDIKMLEFTPVLERVEFL